MKITLAAAVLFSTVGMVFSATKKEAIITCAKAGDKTPCVSAIQEGNTKFTLKEKEGWRIENPVVEFYVSGKGSCRNLNTAILSIPACKSCFIHQIAGVSTCVDEKY